MPWAWVLGGSALQTALGLESGGIQILRIWPFLAMVGSKEREAVLVSCVSAAGLLQEGGG